MHETSIMIGNTAIFKLFSVKTENLSSMSKAIDDLIEFVHLVQDQQDGNSEQVNIMYMLSINSNNRFSDIEKYQTDHFKQQIC